MNKDFNRIPEFIKGIVEAELAATEETVEYIAGEARANAPVLTGELRDSIEGQMDGSEGEVVVGAEHGPAIEFGSSRRPATPYLRPAYENNSGTISNIYEKYVSELIRRLT